MEQPWWFAQSGPKRQRPDFAKEKQYALPFGAMRAFLLREFEDMPAADMPATVVSFVQTAGR